MASTPIKVRGGGYGLDAELAQRAAEKYDYELEDQARAWIEGITSMEIGDDFGEGLRNGVILCELVNRIHPGLVKRIETKSLLAFKLMENVSSFLKACRTMGVNEYDLFETVDLFELKDLGIVVRCIHSLGRAVQRNYPDYDGPRLGVKESVKNARQFSSDKMAEGRLVPPMMNMGSMHTMPRTDVRRTNGLTRGADANRVGHRPPPPPPPPSAEKVEMVSRERAAPPPPPRSAADPSATATLPGLNGSAASHQQAHVAAQDDAQKWIEDVVQQEFTGASFGESLKDGVLLCALVNAIKPGSVSRVQQSTMPFKQMENITAFLKACRVIGVSEFDLFETVDLFELKNVDLVVKCIHALGRTVQRTMPEFQGPTLGVRESTANKRTFTEEQIKKGASAVPLLAHGSSGVMQRRDFDRSASITFASDAAVSGLKPTAKKEQEKEEEPTAVVPEEAAPSTSTNGTGDAENADPNTSSSPATTEEAAPASKASLTSVTKGSQKLPTRTVWTM